MNFSFEIDRGERYQLGASQKNEYDRFLQQRRTDLLNKLPYLNCPREISSMADLLTLIESRSLSFKNRELHFRFLKKVEGNISFEDKERLRKITHNFTKCIPSDFETPQEKNQFSLRMWEFLWGTPWIRFAGTKFNLPSFIVKKMALSCLEDVRIVNWELDYPDAAYSAISERDFGFLALNKDVAEVLEFCQGIDINDREISGEYGSDLKSYFQKSSMRFFDVFYCKNVFFLTSAFGPADMVDTLVHEYGHIFFHSKKQHFTKTAANQYTYKKNTLHDEALAETFAWQVLSGLYEDFPEIEFSHTVKQYAFGQFRQDDPHYVGKGSMYPLLKNGIELITELSESNNFPEFVLKSTGRKLEIIPGQRDLVKLKITKEDEPSSF